MTEGKAIRLIGMGELLVGGGNQTHFFCVKLKKIKKMYCPRNGLVPRDLLDHNKKINKKKLKNLEAKKEEQ